MKITVGLFFGGASVEHEVSVISALQALRAFDRDKYTVLPVYITRDHAFYTGEAAGRIEEYRDVPALLKKCTRVLPAREGDRVGLLPYGRFGLKSKPLALLDLAFPVVHGTNVEDGALQGYFRTLGLPFAGPDVEGSAVGMDKYAQKLLYAAAGLPVLPALRLRAGDDRAEQLARISAKLPFPLIVKPLDLGSSVGIRLVKSESELPEALDEAFSFSPRALAEKAVRPLRELNCAVLGDAEEAEASEVEEPVMGDEILSYRDKYEGGAKGGKASGGKGMSGLSRLLPAPISPELREEVRSLAVRAFRALDLSGVARIDFLLNGETGELFINEANTIPGSLSFYLWEPLGLGYTALLDRLVSLALKRERQRGGFRNAVDTGILKGFSGGAKGTKG
ncbi:MAG: D-alanine--D-alanine ligase [Oscillospiraceae bacterium]|nr:D-alanine--D-alanine ligase [Oscillospiraceae bacterium]